MLKFKSSLGFWQKEAAMSSIHVISKAAGQGTKVSRADHMKPLWPSNSDRPLPKPSEGEITHAWSIGVTEAGRFAQPNKVETCPPEVYIG
jgi:hypothetical protein